MKRIFFILIGITLSVNLLAQAGLSQGQAVKQTTANPTSEKKTCPYCGIEMRNITYAWQHETWCPYYKSRSSSGSRSSSAGTEQAVTAVAAATVGAALGNALSNWLNSEPKGDYKRYSSNVPGHTFDYRYDERSGGKKVPKYVVLRDREKGTLGVWENAWTFTSSLNGEITDYPGEWKIKPKFDFINLRFSGVDTHSLDNVVAIVGLKSGKGEDAPMLYGLVEANIGWGYGHELMPVKYSGFVTTNPEKVGNPLLIIVGNPGKDKRMTWGVWKLGPKRKPNKFDKLEAFQVLPEQFEAVTIYQERNIVASKNGKYGLYDNEGHSLIPHEYSSLAVSPTGMVKAQKVEGGKYGVVDLKGQSVLPFEYEDIVLCNGGTVIYGNNGLYAARLPSGVNTSMDYTRIQESFWTKKDGEKVISLFVEKDGICCYLSGGRLIPVQAPVDFAAKSCYYDKLVQKGCSFSAWYDNKTAKLKEEFMKKGEFEREADYQARIANPSNLGKYLTSNIPAPVDEYLKSDNLKKDIVLDTYDTENECFPVHLQDSPWDVIRIPVPFEAAPEFKERAYIRTKSSCILELRNDFPAIKSMSTEIKGINWYDKPEFITVIASF